MFEIYVDFVRYFVVVGPEDWEAAPDPLVAYSLHVVLSMGFYQFYKGIYLKCFTWLLSFIYSAIISLAWKQMLRLFPCPKNR